MDKLPRVTEIIGHFVGIPDVDMSRGSAVHKACELWDKNDLDESTVEDCVMPYLIGYKKFLLMNKVTTVYVEQEVIHPVWRYIGHLDWAGYINGIPMLLDRKSNQVNKGAELQLAAYFEAMKLLPDFKKHFEKCLLSFQKRFLILKPYDCRLTEPVTNYKDFGVFTSMLTVYNWKRLHLGR